MKEGSPEVFKGPDCHFLFHLGGGTYMFAYTLFSTPYTDV